MHVPAGARILPARVSVFVNQAPGFRPLADFGLLVEFEPVLAPEVNARARAVAERLAAVPGVIETVPALRSALVVFDPLVSNIPRLLEAAEAAAQLPRPASAERGHLHEVPVVYGGTAGPDLEEVAALCGLTPDRVRREHASVEYTAYMVGFTPGYPYLGELPGGLRVPRLAAPRLRVPAGSVAIADALTGIYPMDSPGGWRLIGRTPMRIYDPHAADPVLFRPGDRVRFVPISGSACPAAPGEIVLPLPDRPVYEVRQGGLFTTVQDLGRPGFRRLGIPAAGAMDPLALQAANLAVGNSPGAAALEFTAPGPVLRVLDDTAIALAGADLSASLDGADLPGSRRVGVRRGQVLQFGAPRRGVWCYLATSGGIHVTPVLGSAATFVQGTLGGFGGRRLREGDILGRGTTAHRRRPVERDVPMPDGEITVRVIAGPQDDWLTGDARGRLFHDAFVMSSRADRAGAGLDGPPLTHSRTGEFLSDGLLPGAVQVPSGGRPIVIFPDGPTTGGYPKAAAVISADLRLVTQAVRGTLLRFRAVSMEEAVDALRRQRERLAEGRWEKDTPGPK